MPSSNKGRPPIELDGRTLEGGGQLLRIALCLAALIRHPVHITHIRGARSGGGGLKAQHLACVAWLAKACDARVEGGEKGSRTLLFEPRPTADGAGVPAVSKKTTGEDGVRFWEARVEIGTAGSTGLALQAVMPFILFTVLPGEPLPICLTLSGGTNVSGAPSYDYIAQVLLPTLELMGYPGLAARLGKRGWSHGGTSIGCFTLELPARVRRRPLPAFHLTPPRQEGATEGPKARTPTGPTRLVATVLAPGAYHGHFADRLATAISMHFPSSPQTPLEITYEDSQHPKRLYLLLVAFVPGPDPNQSFRLGRDWLYDRKLPATPAGYSRAVAELCGRVVKELAGEWRSGACVDAWMRDQVVIFRALAEGLSEVEGGRAEGEAEEEVDGKGGAAQREPSLHARTAEWVCREMLGVRFDGAGRCEGVGFGRDEEAGEVREGIGGLKLDDGDEG
ncbi:hypothetical protein LTR53_006871 [Teratosphaeriaceae sp. CCFEE 6253]|nr:hypothetical protein LTR53_006871 [Teratosphaeriaceae sp. CCFEE 6253]